MKLKLQELRGTSKRRYWGLPDPLSKPFDIPTGAHATTLYSGPTTTAINSELSDTRSRLHSSDLGDANAEPFRSPELVGYDG